MKKSNGKLKTTPTEQRGVWFWTLQGFGFKKNQM